MVAGSYDSERIRNRNTGIDPTVRQKRRLNKQPARTNIPQERNANHPKVDIGQPVDVPAQPRQEESLERMREVSAPAGSASNALTQLPAGAGESPASGLPAFDSLSGDLQDTIKQHIIATVIGNMIKDGTIQ